MIMTVRLPISAHCVRFICALNAPTRVAEDAVVWMTLRVGWTQCLSIASDRIACIPLSAEGARLLMEHCAIRTAAGRGAVDGQPVC